MKRMVALLVLLALACADDEGEILTEEEAARLCEQAEDKLEECFGVEVAFEPCDGTRARALIDRSCVQIVDDFAQPKSDDPEDWFCPTFPEICE